MQAIASTPAARRRASILEWVTKVQSLTFSTVIHAMLILMLGGTVLFDQYARREDFAAPPTGLLNEETTVTPPLDPKPTINPPQDSPSATNATTGAMSPSMLVPLTTKSLTISNYAVPLPRIAGPTKPAVIVEPKPPGADSAVKGLDIKIARGIAAFTANWAKGGTASFSKPLKTREFEFTAYLAKYQDGDWDSTVELEDGQIWKGSLPNLLYIITKLSKNKIHAEPQVFPLDLTSNEIFEKAPPFIWFTGHRDFKLTDKEVEVLGEYLRRGGCIWGDSSLPGQRSRFDIAFRREMLRVVPDPNQPWAPLPPNHPIFTKAYYSEIRGIAPGINFYDEPIYALAGYGGEIAVIYTANDYGDMWQFGIDEKGQVDFSVDERRRYVAINRGMWDMRNIYLRNVEPKSLFNSYKFGTNIIIHLVTRWEDKIRNVPMGKPSGNDFIPGRLL